MSGAKVKRFRPGLRRQMVVLLLILFGISVAVGGTGLLEARRLAMQAEAERVRSSVTFVTATIDTIAAQNRALATVMAASPRLVAAMRAQDKVALQGQLAASFTLLQPEFHIDALRVYAADGRMIAGLPQNGDPAADQQASLPMIAAVNQSQVSRQGIARTREGLPVEAAVPIRDQDGTPLGVILLGTALTGRMLSEHEAPGFDATSLGVTVHLEEGQGGMRRAASSAGQPSLLSPAELRAGARDDADIVTVIRTASGLRRLATVAPLLDWSGLVAGAIEVTVDAEALVARLDRILFGYCGVVVGLLLLGCGLTLLGGRQVASSMRDLGHAQAALHGLARGERMPMPVSLAWRDDEIGMLARTLGRLGEGIDRQQVVTRELNHRIKNILLVVQSLAVHTLRSVGGDPVRFQADFSGRLQAIALAQDLLLARGGAAVPLDATIRAALAPWLDTAGKRLVLEACPMVLLQPRQVKSLLLALHELATNAAKHGALSTPTGSVSLGCHRQADGRMRLDWREAGGPALAGRPGRTGFGLRLLESGMAADLGEGRVALRFETAGLCASIAFRPQTADPTWIPDAGPLVESAVPMQLAPGA